MQHKQLGKSARVSEGKARASVSLSQSLHGRSVTIGSYNMASRTGGLCLLLLLLPLLVACQMQYPLAIDNAAKPTAPGTPWIIFAPATDVADANRTTISFDSNQVVTAPVAAPSLKENFILSTTDGLSLTLARDSGVIPNLAIDHTRVSTTTPTYATGFFVRDVADQSAYFHVGGLLTQTANLVTHTSDLPSLDLSFTATYRATADRIQIHAALTNLQPTDRSLTLYFALPVAAAGWTWGDDIRNSRLISGTTEFANLGGILWHYDLGATGYVSKYPWAALTSSNAGLALAVPLAQPRLVRLIYNPAMRQFYAAFDLALSPLTAKFPNQAWIELVIYRYRTTDDDRQHGFRAATQAYYDHFPSAFIRRIPPAQEGPWVAFTDLSTIPQVSDFGIAAHELENEGQIAFNEAANILSFRYLSEPWSHWLPITTTAVDAGNYDQALHYLQARQFTADDSKRVQATLTSALFDEKGRYQYEAITTPWCQGLGGCALFFLNPDPDLATTAAAPNKATHDWNPKVKELYASYPGLDGEYIDSFPNQGQRLNFRTEHWPAVDIPLVYRTSDHRAGILEFFAVNEFVRWVAQDVHAMGKFMMANGAALEMPWGVDLFDFSGQETNWMNEGAFEPLPIDALDYRRTLMAQKPYSFLMNTDFAQFTPVFVERYFQTCLFYGFYPSMFFDSGLGASYWELPRFYERDRALFRRYIPLIKQLNQAGWQPLPYAHTSHTTIMIERFGHWPELYFTLHNPGTTTTTVTIELAAALNLPNVPITAHALLAGTTHPLSPTALHRHFSVTLDPQTSEMVELRVPQ